MPLTVFGPDPGPKKSPEDPKKVGKGLKFGRFKIKKIGLHFQNMFLTLTPTLKLVPKDKK